MLPKNNNNISYRNNSMNNIIRTPKKYSKRIITSNLINSKKMNDKNSKLDLNKELIKAQIDEFKNNKNSNKYSFFDLEKEENINNTNNLSKIDNNNDKNKSNNVTNNICIIIKTSDNKELGDEDKKNYKLKYYNSLKKNKIKNYSIDTNNINTNDRKINNLIGNSNLITNNNNDNDKLFTIYNKSFIYKRKNNIRNNTINSNRIKYKYRNKNSSILIPKNRINLKTNYIYSPREKISKYSKNILYTDNSEKSFETNGSLLSFNLKKLRINAYKESIRKKRELLGVNYNVKEKNKANKEMHDEFNDYDKEREEIEKKILISDQIIQNEEKITYSKYKKREPRRVFSGDIYNYAKNKSIEKFSKKCLDTTFNFDNNNSKSEISSFQVESNKDELKNNQKKLKYKKRNNDNLLNYKNSMKNFDINRIRKNKLFNNNNLINSRSYRDIFIKEENMQKNINTIVKDIIKILNESKSKKKPFKSPKRPRENIFSPRKEIIMIQKNENGKTLRCIKKRCRDKSKNNEERVIINHNIEEEPEEENNNIDNINNYTTIKNNKNKEENKKLEINIPGGEIEALRRIKNKIKNYKKNQKFNKRKFIYREIKSKSFSFAIRKNIINKQIIKRLKSEKLVLKLKTII